MFTGKSLGSTQIVQILSQGCTKFLIVDKKGRKYHGCGEEYKKEKMEWGRNIICNICREVAEGDGNFWEENQELKNADGKNMRL